MKNVLRNITRFSLLMLLVTLVVSCSKDDDKEIEPELAIKETLVRYQWKMVDVTDENGNKIPENRLDVMTKYLFNLNFAFAANNTVKALDSESNQVANGGTWYLKDDNKVLDIDVSGFEGQFLLKSITTSKMSLQNTLKVGGQEQEAIMVFEPIVK